MATPTETGSGQLWAVHVEGPCEVTVAIPDREAAEAAAKGINAQAGTAPNRPKVTARAIPWPGTPEQHAADLGSWELEIADPDEDARADGTSGGER